MSQDEDENKLTITDVFFMGGIRWVTASEVLNTLISLYGYASEKVAEINKIFLRLFSLSGPPSETLNCITQEC
jgi:hypothetical protein